MAITQTGSTLTFPAPGLANTGTVSTTITVPADAQIVIVGWSGFSSTTGFFGTGSMTFTKGGVDTAMTNVGVDQSPNGFTGATFYLALPDTGSNKTLKWDWAGANVAETASLCSVTFWTGIDTVSPVRDTDFGLNIAGSPYTTPTLTCVTGDLIVAYVGAFVNSVEGTVDTWSNLTLLTQLTHSAQADGAWATGSPTGNVAVAALTDTNMDDGTIAAIVLKAASAAAVTPPTLFSFNSVW